MFKVAFSAAISASKSSTLFLFRPLELLAALLLLLSAMIAHWMAPEIVGRSRKKQMWVDSIVILLTANCKWNYSNLQWLLCYWEGGQLMVVLLLAAIAIASCYCFLLFLPAVLVKATMRAWWRGGVMAAWGRERNRWEGPASCYCFLLVLAAVLSRQRWGHDGAVAWWQREVELKIGGKVQLDIEQW